MKKIIYFILALVITTTGCSDDYKLEDFDLSVTELPGYVAFSAPGANATIDPIDTQEDAGSEDLNVEVPGGTLTDVTVNYSFSGTAVYGVDFEVSGANSSGGTLIIAHTQSTDPDDFNFADNADIVIELLTDAIADGDKTLQVTLVSASNGEGELAVGRGGTDYLRTAIVNIADID